MIDVEEESWQLFDNMIGTENDLNHVLSNFVDSEHEIPNFCHSRYVDTSEVQSLFQNNREFLILTLNIQSINVKFNNVFIYFKSSITSHRNIYNLGPFVCKRPGLPVILICRYHNSLDTNSFTKVTAVLSMVVSNMYLNENYSYTIRNLNNSSNIWEGLFIDINGSNLCRTLTIGNMYRPTHDNNNNVNIQFISELSPIIEILQGENTYTAIVGDFNINLLKTSERNKFCEFF